MTTTNTYLAVFLGSKTNPRMTKKVSSRGVEDIGNEMGAFTLVRAESHEAAAKMFENHPHFMIFPGQRIEIMPVLPIPA